MAIFNLQILCFLWSSFSDVEPATQPNERRQMDDVRRGWRIKFVHVFKTFLILFGPWFASPDCRGKTLSACW